MSKHKYLKNEWSFTPVTGSEYFLTKLPIGRLNVEAKMQRMLSFAQITFVIFLTRADLKSMS